MDEDKRTRRCLGKIRFDSKRQAKAKAREKNRKHSDNQAVYQCPACKFWHIGHARRKDGDRDMEYEPCPYCGKDQPCKPGTKPTQCIQCLGWWYSRPDVEKPPENVERCSRCMKYVPKLIDRERQLCTFCVFGIKP